MSQPTDPGHPLGTEIDDSQNPTEASPSEVGTSGPSTGSSWQEEHSETSHQSSDAEPDGRQESTGRQREMLRQLQEMIDQVAREARPVMREVAAKSAELAALAAERAGPLAAKAAEKTQVYGDRFAARSKEKAAELRRQEGQQAEGPTEEPETVAGAPDDGAVMHPWGETSSLEGDQTTREG
ncbi:MAG TPA: hypothetical protein VM305_02955 [Candidatus Limnocylindrales bacterium]|nr:hypothetical protein [Candidatus Limnocylindrales bacterium]